MRLPSRFTIACAALTVFLACGTAAASRTIYGAAPATDQIFGYALPATGQPTAVSGLPAGAGISPSQVAVTADGMHVYVAHGTAATLNGFNVGSSGGLVASANSPYSLTSRATAIVGSLNPSFIYVGDAAGSVMAMSVGVLGDLTPVQGSAASDGIPTALAVAPGGAMLYAVNTDTSTLSRFALGSAVSKVGSAVAVGTSTSPAGIAITPDGQSLFVAESATDKIRRYTIAPDGGLTDDGTADAGNGPASMAITPDGSTLLVANRNAATISRFTIGPGATLASLGDATPGPSGLLSVAVRPDGKQLIASGGTTIDRYVIANGTLTPLGSSLTTTTALPSVVITPNQAPQARFTSAVTAAASESSFTATTSSDSESTVKSWRWTFGDGATATGETVTHTYAAPGNYTVSLAVTDDEGCSEDSVSTGTAVLCNGSRAARTTRVVHVDELGPLGPLAPPCAHDGNDGFCGTPDQKAPQIQVLLVRNGANYSIEGAPSQFVGIITPDPSGYASVRLRLMKPLKPTTPKKKTTKKKKKKKKHPSSRKKKKKKKKKVTAAPAAQCMVLVAPRNEFVKRACKSAPFIELPKESPFHLEPPVLSVGTYQLDVDVTDGAGNSDVVETGRNHFVFSISAKGQATIDSTVSDQSSGPGL